VHVTKDEVLGAPTLTAAAAFGAVVPIGKDDEVPGQDILAARAVLAAPAGCTEFPAPSSFSGKHRRVRLSFNFVISRGKVACYKKRQLNFTETYPKIVQKST
jgi:hypothetical protein